MFRPLSESFVCFYAPDVLLLEYVAMNSPLGIPARCSMAFFVSQKTLTMLLWEAIPSRTVKVQKSRTNTRQMYSSLLIGVGYHVGVVFPSHRRIGLDFHRLQSYGSLPFEANLIYVVHCVQLPT